MSPINYIYGLKCPISDQIRYIGKTTNLKRRYASHLREKTDYHKNRWINALLKKGLKPEIVLIDEIIDGNWKDAEIGYIKLFKSFGADLVNTTLGGGDTPLLSGNKNPNWGKFGELNHRSKDVLVFDLDGNFIEVIGSTKQAGKLYDVDPSSVVKCCNYQLHKTKNGIFRYRNEFDEIPHKIKPSKKVVTNHTYINSKPIIQYDLNGNVINKFSSITEASIIVNISKTAIYKSINNKTKERKYIWKHK